jgi:hypothetical protein
MATFIHFLTFPRYFNLKVCDNTNRKQFIIMLWLKIITNKLRESKFYIYFLNSFIYKYNKHQDRQYRKIHFNQLNERQCNYVTSFPHQLISYLKRKKNVIFHEKKNHILLSKLKWRKGSRWKCMSLQVQRQLMFTALSIVLE